MEETIPTHSSGSHTGAKSDARAELFFHNRYTRAVEKEVIYGEGFLRWVYGNPLGKLSLHALVKRSLFSQWYGWRMQRSASRRKVLPFIRQYGLDPAEFADAPESYSSFNEFFYRRLKPSARPLDSDPDSVVFPADGRHFGFQELGKNPGIFAKGQTLSLNELLGDSNLAARYSRGSMVISRLCPVDYHRFHFPVSGTPGPTRLIPGYLSSVNPIALRQRIQILVENKRWITEIDTANQGKVLMLEIGATCVGSAIPTAPSGVPVRKGDEKGYFQFGGSMTLCLFEPGRVTLAADLVEQSRNGIELYAHMGDTMGRWQCAPSER